MDTDSFADEIGTEDFYRYIAKDVEKRFDTNGYSKDENRPLPIGKNKKVIGPMEDELGGKIMTEFVALRAKMYAYRKTDRLVEEKCCKGTKNVWSVKALGLMTIRPACLMVKQHTVSKCCLRIRTTRCTLLISIRRP